MSKPSVSASYLALAAVCAALFFWNLGSVPLVGRDEGMYAETAREMLASGDYVLPTYNAQPFFEKPPLVYWLQAASMRVIGVNPLAARLPSAVAASLLIALTVALGTRLYDRRSGVLAGFALATTVLTTGLARWAVMDMVFALTITAALGAFLLSHTGKLPRRGYLGLWICAGLAVMVKGPAGAVLILCVATAFLVLRRRPREVGRMMPLLGPIVFAAVAAPWYVLVQRASGGEFLREFIIHQNVQRALGMDFQHNMPFYFYVPIYLVGFFPWSVLVPRAWARLVRLRPVDASGASLRSNASSADPAGEASLFAAVWMVTVVVVFSLSRSKLPAYIYPAFPPSALLVGAMWSRSMSERPQGRGGGAFAAICAGMTALLLIAVLIGLPIAARRLSGPVLDVAREVRALAAPREIIYAYEFWLPPELVFYSRHAARQLDTRPELDAVLKPGHECLVVTRYGKATDLPAEAKLVLRSDPFSLYRITRPPLNPESP